MNRVFLLLTVLSVSATAQTPMESDGSILLPSQKNIGVVQREPVQRLYSGSQAWLDFSRAHGAWTVQWNEATGTPHRAYGNAIPISGFRTITKRNVAAAAQRFLLDNAPLWKVDPSELRLVRTEESERRWYVSYVQTWRGIDVLLSEVELRIFENGNVMALGADCYPAITISSTPSLTFSAAKQNAVSGLSRVTAVRGDGTLFVLPVRNGGDIIHHLVYEVFVESSDPPGNYATYVDAHDGTIVWRHNRIRYTLVRGRSQGTVQLVLPTDPFVGRDFADEWITVGGNQVTTDGSGRFNRDITAPAQLVARLEGRFVNVNRQESADAQIIMSVNPGDSVNLLWDDSNSHPAERDAYYHVNLVHKFITTLDTTLTFLDYSMPCAVNINSTCNAFWDGNGVNFFLDGGGCPNTAQMPSVVYHEYGHGVNDKTYQQHGASSGMINGATHEGMADVNAAMIEDSPDIGRGFFGSGSVLRQLVNTARYPANVSGDPHITGLIIGGAFWDLRVAVGLNVARHLSHFARWGTPDDPDVGIAFSEWFVETLVADDDDGNLGNGTPHMIQISNAFSAHGIGSSLFFTRSFQHTPLASTYDTTNAYPVVFVLEGTPIPGGAPDSLRIVYTTNGFQTSQSVMATEIGLDTYRGDIPAQHGGSAVRYYITAYDRLSNTRFSFPAGAPATGWYGFLVGIHPARAATMYASSSLPTSKLYTVNTATGGTTEVGPLGIAELQGLAIKPSTKELFGTVSNPVATTFYRVSPSYGDASPIRILPIPNLRAIAFASNDDLYGATSSGRLYRINLITADTTYVGTASGVIYAAISFNPRNGKLYGSVRPPIVNRDRIYTINTSTGQATLLGPTGDGLITPSITVAPNGTLYGLKGSGAQTNTLISIDTTTGAGTTIGSAGLTGLSAIVMRNDSLLTPVVETGATLPAVYELSQNYPNPFNPTTTIRYALPRAGLVSLKIFNVLGEQVAVIVDGMQDAGYKSAEFDASTLSSGVYLYELRSADQIITRKMVLLR